jgi:hypothetical protein
MCLENSKILPSHETENRKELTGLETQINGLGKTRITFQNLCK